MDKKIIIRMLVISVLLTLFSFSIKASIFATIGVKGLSFASPEAAQVIQTVVCASNPASCAAGYLTQQVTGELMQEIAKQSPEAVKAVQQYNQVKGWVDEGAKITEDLKLTENGQFAGGSVVNKEKQNLKDLTGNAIGEVENIKTSTKGENEPFTLEATENGASATVGENTYTHLKKGSTITADRNGEVKEADLTFTKPTTVKLGGKEIQADKDMRIVYKDDKLEVYGKDQTVQVDKQKILINGENQIKIDNQKITGKDFTLDEKRFTGIEDKIAEVTISDKGYLLGKNTIAEDERMIITSEKGNVLYSRMCEDVSGFDNYVSPCKATLTMQGEGLSVQLREGRHFGMDLEKDDALKYGLSGGKIVIDNGEQTILPEEQGDIIITNGNLVTRSTKIDSVAQELIYPDSIGEKIDVSMTTKYENGEIVTVTDEETGTEQVYVCPTGSAAAGAITGAASLLEKCKAAVGLNTRNVFELQQSGEGIVKQMPLPSGGRAIDGLIVKKSAIEGFPESDEFQEVYSNVYGVKNPTEENVNKFLRLKKEYEQWRKSFKE